MRRLRSQDLIQLHLVSRCSRILAEVLDSLVVASSTLAALDPRTVQDSPYLGRCVEAILVLGIAQHQGAALLVIRHHELEAIDPGRHRDVRQRRVIVLA
jgi:hypothetical protein